MAYARHAPAGPPGPVGRSMAACAFLGRARVLTGRVLRAQVRATAAHPSPRCPRRGAQRSAGTVAMRVHRGTRRSRGRSRAAAARLRRDGGKRRRHAEALRAIPLFCVTTATVCLRHRRTAPATACRAQFRPGSSRPLVFQGKVRYDGIHAPAFPRYSAAGLPASGPRPLRRSPQGLSDLRARRRRRYVDVPARIGTGSPARLWQAGRSRRVPAADPSPSPRAPDLISVRSGSQGSPRFLRLLPG